ncbi:hypothetical protein [Paenibacillus polymyxa]|uniref:Uncharacterized protein n=1 Tax=Paenibacillus polymyxa TaxID=1406 RepID=A0AAE9IAJ4_PAEPO|nr:hypothetical protein [Paenibacillus polymyxa]URJ48735.1 hypothetical protein MF626_003010 [Paenibacillus polymyxa]
MGIDRFFEGYPKYKGYEENCTVKDIYNWLSLPQRIAQMVQTCEQGKPALEAVVEELERAFDLRLDFSFDVGIDEKNQFHKQMVGAMIKEILWDFGYIQTLNKRFSARVNSKYFKSGMIYKFNPEYETKRIIIQYDIDSIGELLHFNRIIEN